ncbi:MAG: lipopolysaccharide biosynthesis protein [Polyangiaceae bacterium]|nr:lipopolysaccharide biosynthesis protein [Polyangiaceae bacterium]
MTRAEADRRFNTSHLMHDLKGRTLRGGTVALVAQAAKFAFKLAETVVLARLLAPTDFGLVAMVTAATGMVGIFKDFSLSTATVQRSQITHEQVSTLFWINLGLGVCLTGLIVVVAPILVWFYHEPRLLLVTVAVAGTMVLASLGVQHTAILRREMRFTSLAAIDLTSIVLADTVAVVMAWYGAGYWALVGLLTMQSLSQSLGSWLACGWLPDRPRRGTGVRPLLAFGGHLTAFEFVNYFSRNADNVLIGWASGPASLGLYGRAYDLMMVPTATIRGPLISVALPALSRLSCDPVRYRHYYCRMTEALAFLSMPLAALLFVTADSLIVLALGPAWRGAIPIFQILAFTAFLQPTIGLRGVVLLSTGQGARYFYLGLGVSVLTVTSFLAGLPWGPIGVATAYGIANYAMVYPSLRFAFRATPIVATDYFSAVRGPAVSSVAAAAATMLAQDALGATGSVRRLVASACLFLFMYIVTLALLPGGRGALWRFAAYARTWQSGQRSPVSAEKSLSHGNDVG